MATCRLQPHQTGSADRYIHYSRQALATRHSTINRQRHRGGSPALESPPTKTTTLAPELPRVPNYRRGKSDSPAMELCANRQCPAVCVDPDEGATRMEQRHETASPRDYMEPREFVELLGPAIARSPLSTIRAGSGPERPETGRLMAAQGFDTGIWPHTSANTEREELIRTRLVKRGLNGSKAVLGHTRFSQFPFSSFFYFLFSLSNSNLISILWQIPSRIKSTI
jgi:hypothetical protein